MAIRNKKKKYSAREVAKIFGVSEDNARKAIGGLSKSSSGRRGQVLGASTSSNDPMRYGAGARGEVDLTDEQSKQLKEASEKGVSASEYGNVLSGGYRIPTLSASESADLAKQYGLSGLVDPDKFQGLTRSRAVNEAEREGYLRRAQTSARNTSVFNPSTISGFKNKLGELRLSLDNKKDYPFTNSNQKKTESKALVDSYTDQLAGLFGSPDEYQAALQNADFQKSLQEYQQMGGDPNNIASRVTAPVTAEEGEVLSPYQQPDGSQDLSQFLGNLSSPSDIRARDSLIPEKNIYQMQIQQQQQIPQQYMDAYFGTEEQVGFIEQRKKQMQEEVKLLERQAKSEERNLEAQANLAIERNKRQMQIEQDTIEENRLAAKNYMTGMLAKLGALKTTGKAPEALMTLEQKYQKQAQQLRTDYDFANQEIEIKLNEAVTNTKLSRDEQILSLRSDLSKDEEDVWKEIFKLQNAADKQTLTIVEKYAQEFRTQREKYGKEAKAAAEKNAKEMEKLASSYDISRVSDVSNYDKFRNEYLATEEGKLLARRYGQDNIRLGEELRKLYSKSIKKPGSNNYTATTIPSELRQALISAINRGTPLKELYSEYPDVSDSMIRTLYNSENDEDDEDDEDFSWAIEG